DFFNGHRLETGGHGCLVANPLPMGQAILVKRGLFEINGVVPFKRNAVKSPRLVLPAILEHALRHALAVNEPLITAIQSAVAKVRQLIGMVVLYEFKRTRKRFVGTQAYIQRTVPLLPVLDQRSREHLLAKAI